LTSKLAVNTSGEGSQAADYVDVNTLLCYTLVSVLVLGIGIGSGQYYRILGIGWLSWYRSNPTQDETYA